MPLGVPHASTEDDVYNGFFIPKGKFLSLSCALQFTVWELHSKGAIMMANTWYVIYSALQISFSVRCIRAILHNPDLYPDPEVFKPERFLNEDGTLRDDPLIPMAFGVGKRICPGRHFVDSTLFIVASSVLSVFNIVKAKDENGGEIPVNVAPSFESSIVV